MYHSADFCLTKYYLNLLSSSRVTALELLKNVHLGQYLENCWIVFIHICYNYVSPFLAWCPTKYSPNPSVSPSVIAREFVTMISWQLNVIILLLLPILSVTLFSERISIQRFPCSFQYFTSADQISSISTNSLVPVMLVLS